MSYTKRRMSQQLESKLLELADNNPIIHTLMVLWRKEQFREDDWFELAIETLARENESMRKALVDLHSRTVVPMIILPDDLPGQGFELHFIPWWKRLWWRFTTGRPGIG